MFDLVRHYIVFLFPPSFIVFANLVNNVSFYLSVQ